MTSRALVAATIASAALLGCGAVSNEAPADAGMVFDSSVVAPSMDLSANFDLAIVSGPARLSETGLYSDFPSRTLAPGIIHFTPRYPLWSDGAEKDRYLLLPPGTKIDTSDMDNWTFPVGTRAWKQFKRDGRLVETRLLQKQKDDRAEGWWEMSYAWNDAETEAFAVPKGVTGARGTTHDIPPQKDCAKCHEGVVDNLIGVSAIQLSAADGKGMLSQLGAAGLLSNPAPHEYEVPGDGVVKAALGYLHGNCAHCHASNNNLAQFLRLRLRLSVDERDPKSTEIYLTSINTKDIHTYLGDINVNVVPGNPQKSQIYMRMGVRDFWAMPPQCTNTVDADAMATIGAWIKSLPP